MRIYLAPSGFDNHKVDDLKSLARLAVDPRHIFTDDPEEADLVLVPNCE
jgi:hypothetical protein